MGPKFFHYELIGRDKMPLQSGKHVPWKYSRHWESIPKSEDFMEEATEVDSNKELTSNMENTTGRREEIRI